jgi:DNA-directed RNA polymerase subunit K
MQVEYSIEEVEKKFTKYEIARILGARSLQLAMDAPVLLKLTKEEEEEINYDTLKIAERELVAGVLPITVRRPLPKKSTKVIKKLSEEEIKEKLEEQIKQEKKVEEVKPETEKTGEEGEEEEKTENEMMEMATPEDEVEEEAGEASELE